MDTSVCSKCKKKKSVTKFSFDKKRQKPRSWCKECHNAHTRHKYDLGDKYKSSYLEKIEHRKDLMKQGLKPCSICMKTKPLGDFRVHGGRIQSLCIACHLEKMKKYHIVNRVKSKRKRQKQAMNIEGRIVLWKRGARARGIRWSVSTKHLKSIPLKCHYTGFDLTFEMDKQNTISLDRIDSHKGYVNGNVVFCCSDINYMKSDLHIEEFKMLCKAVAKHNS